MTKEQYLRADKKLFPATVYLLVMMFLSALGDVFTKKRKWGCLHPGGCYDIVSDCDSCDIHQQKRRKNLRTVYVRSCDPCIYGAYDVWVQS